MGKTSSENVSNQLAIATEQRLTAVMNGATVCAQLDWIFRLKPEATGADATSDQSLNSRLARMVRGLPGPRSDLNHNLLVVDVKPPVSAELIWSDHLRFGATSGPNALVIDGDGAAGPSPMQLAAFGLAGCMAIDVVSILQKGRHPLTGMRATFSGERAEEPPRRYVRITLHFHVTGAVPAEAVERAIALSRDKYCSVWHSFRQDIDFTTTYALYP